MPLLKPNKFKLYINDSGEFKDIQTVYGKKIADLNRLRKDNRLREKIGSKGERRSELKLKLLKLSKVKLAAERNFVAEKVKIDSYISQLDKLKVERQNLIGSKKVDDVLNELSSAESCPLCDSELELNITNHELTEYNYHSSLNFITSKISMVEKYIAMFKYVQDDFDRENKYYNDVILSLKEQISYINRDALSDVELSISREKIYKEINLANEVEKLNRLITEFEKSLDKLIKLNHSVVIINSSISDIDIAFERDLIKIKNFEVKFRNYLKRFDYTSNETWKVNIRDKMPYKLLPSVFNNAIKSNQPIRNASSASDFIRAEWSFYLTLLELSVCHPGILIFDEPGQHAMSPKTLKELVTVCSNLTGKQVLLAISKFTKGYDEFKEENTWSINNLIEGRNNIRVIDIDDDEQKLVKLLS
ncbi:conserved hypothetical protein [Photobacterium leiognathi lrivu.4.1]|uniref:Uncharacterized protein n=1 Tax=Photobacterium leiognathi lrivu.4.1 TaxID=1248232 RepID=V5EP24_PHOLE|nr:hypothetical protein [Photobacterium leiognathi]GAD31526.1 conserved hypothetical protein [Photobacterium leiognathi lrivu.4.1]